VFPGLSGGLQWKNAVVDDKIRKSQDGKTASSLLLFKSSKVSAWFGQFTLLFLLAFHVVLMLSTHINVTSNFGNFPHICPTYLYSLRKSILSSLRRMNDAVKNRLVEKVLSDVEGCLI